MLYRSILLTPVCLNTTLLLGQLSISEAVFSTEQKRSPRHAAHRSEYVADSLLIRDTYAGADEHMHVIHHPTGMAESLQYLSGDRGGVFRSFEIS